MFSIPAAKADQSGIQAAKKRPYQPPALIRYGAVKDLTQGGVTGNTETPGNCSATNKSIPCPGTPSDRRIKERIEWVGQHPLGIALYLFDYKPAFQHEFGTGRQFGVMADEVEDVMPGAVSLHPLGFKTVRYDLLGVERFH